MVMELVAQSFVEEFKKHKVTPLEVSLSSSENISTRNLKKTDVLKLSLLEILILSHMGDRFLPFFTRRDMILGTKLCTNVLDKFGLVPDARKTIKQQNPKICSSRAL